MRTTDADFLASIAGTTVNDRVTGVVWRGDSDPLPVSVTGWSINWDASRVVQGQATLTIADPEGFLAPWGFGDMLAPGGSMLYLAWESGATGARVPMGFWRIRNSDPVTQWRVYQDRNTSAVTRVPSGGYVTIRADEVTASVVLARLDAVPGPTKAYAFDEIVHLLSETMAVTAGPGVPLTQAAPRVSYGEDRMEAVWMNLDALRAVCRVGPGGALEVIIPGGSPVWTIEGGDAGVLVDVSWSLSDEGVYNAAVSKGQTPEGAPLIGRAYIAGGPLAYGGPFGRVPIFHQAAATTQAGVQQDAETLLLNRAENSRVTLPVECLTNPALQPHDVVTVVAPTIVGDEPLNGYVTSMQIQSAASDAGIVPAKRMAVGVSVSALDLEAIADRVNGRQSWRI